MTEGIVVSHVGGSTLAGREQRLPGPRVKLGRRPDNDVAFDAESDRKVSGYHAEAYLEGGVVFVQDVGSNNGTYVNGVRIAGPTALQPADMVRLGESGPTLRFALGVKPVGEATLLRAVDDAARRERSRTRSVLAGLAGLAVVGAGIALYVQAENGREIRARVALAEADANSAKRDADEAKRLAQEVDQKLDREVAAALARHDREVAAFEERLADGEAKAARLVVEMNERARALDEVRKRQDLAEKDREALASRGEEKLAALRDELHAAEAVLRKEARGGDAAWADVAERYRQSIFLIVGQSPTSLAIGTAWVVRADGLLATNAHVAEILKTFAIHAAIQNGTGAQFTVEKHVVHPDYHGPYSPDLALVKIATRGASLVPLALASEGELRKLRVGTHIGTLGFPGELMLTYLSGQDGTTKAFTTAQATFKDGWVGRLTDYKGQTSGPADTRLIQHSASVTGGCSGSPLFTADGKVIAIHNSGENEMVVVKQGDKTVEKRIKNTAMISRGVRADELARFLAASGL